MLFILTYYEIVFGHFDGGFSKFLRLSDLEEFFPSCFTTRRNFVGIINIYLY